MRIRKLLCIIAATVVLSAVFIAPAPAENRDVNVKIMTRNMYAGSELMGVAAAQTPEELRLAVLTVITNVIQSDIPGRAALVAAEIADKKPDFVALQEASKWQIQTPSGTLVLDQLNELLQSLHKCGQHYRVAVAQELASITIPNAASYTDRDVLLVRSDLPPTQLKISGSEIGRYDYFLSFPLLDGTTISVPRGWIAVNVKMGNSKFKVVNTHLESPIPGVPDTQLLQLAQAAQLMEALGETKIPVIVAGDFNSDAEPTKLYPPDATESYDYIVGAGFNDAWQFLHPRNPGYTWPLFDDTGAGISPIERIDLIFSNGPKPISMTRFGTTPNRKGLYASDHAGMVAVFDLLDHHPGHSRNKPLNYDRLVPDNSLFNWPSEFFNHLWPSVYHRH
jgi:endonuclease/exonuclease/phosphatase family metal-dependent hydrolase